MASRFKRRIALSMYTAFQAMPKLSAAIMSSEQFRKQPITVLCAQLYMYVIPYPFVRRNVAHQSRGRQRPDMVDLMVKDLDLAVRDLAVSRISEIAPSAVNPKTHKIRHIKM